MSRQSLSTVQVFQFYSRKRKNLQLQSCPKAFVWFLCECIVYLLEGNLQSSQRHHLTNFQNAVWLFFLKRTIWKLRRSSGIRKWATADESYFSSRQKPLDLTWSSLFSSLLLCTTKVWIPSPLKTENFQNITVYKIPRTKIFHLKRRYKRFLFCLSNILVDKIFSCPVSSSGNRKR